MTPLRATAGMVAVWHSSAEPRPVLVDPGKHLLLVAFPDPLARPGCQTLRRWERVTFVPSEHAKHGAEISVAPGTAVFEFALQYMEAACGAADMLLRAEFEVANRKIGALARQLMVAEWQEASASVAQDILWLALARCVGSAFGGPRGRAGDAWFNPVALRRTVEFVEEGLAGELSVASMAGVAGLGPSAFLRAFRGATGMTPGDYLLERRMALASSLLVSTELPVAQIATRAGFGSSNHFATTFAARRGMPPTAFRREALRRVQ